MFLSTQPIVLISCFWVQIVDFACTAISASRVKIYDIIFRGFLCGETVRMRTQFIYNYNNNAY